MSGPLHQTDKLKVLEGRPGQSSLQFSLAPGGAQPLNRPSPCRECWELSLVKLEGNDHIFQKLFGGREVLLSKSKCPHGDAN